jgi:3-oxoacyl-[acyl-carrier-protein] synthase II
MKRRVVITGMGMISPLGVGNEMNWRALMEGRSGIGPITRFDATEFPGRIAGEVRDFDATQFVDKKDVRKMDIFIHYAVAATQFALEDAGFRITPDNAERTGVYIGSGIGGLPSIERQHRSFLENGVRRISPFFIPGIIVNMASGQVAIRFGAKGPNSAVCTACTTGTHAIGDAFRLIQHGQADVMVAGGTEAVITPLAVGGFCAMKALSTRNAEPERASRPFDAGRDGFVMGEGAGILLLEELEGARARGVRPYAEIVGYGMSGDAYHISAPSEDGDGPIRVMRAALDDAGAEPAMVDYINAHGTSTPVGDRVETFAIKAVFGEQARELAISATKSMTGHLLGAAGGIETAITARAVRDGMLPPTINVDDPDPECDLDYVPNRVREQSVRYALNNGFGFGGTNGSLLLARIQG